MTGSIMNCHDASPTATPFIVAVLVMTRFATARGSSLCQEGAAKKVWPR